MHLYFLQAEEEKFIRAMRREMVPLARPVPSFARPFVPQRYASVSRLACSEFGSKICFCYSFADIEEIIGEISCTLIACVHWSSCICCTAFFQPQWNEPEKHSNHSNSTCLVSWNRVLNKTLSISCRSSKEPTRPLSPHFSQKTPRDENRLARSWAQETPSFQRRIQMRWYLCRNTILHFYS